MRGIVDFFSGRSNAGVTSRKVKAVLTIFVLILGFQAGIAQAGWVSRTSGTTENLNDVAYGGGTYVAVGDNGIIRYSGDGVSWAAASGHDSENYTKVVYGASAFVAVGSNNTIVRSTDGQSWTNEDPAGGASDFEGLSYTNSKFIATGTPDEIYTSDDDGQSWSVKRDNPLHVDFFGAAWNGTKYIAVGYGGVIISSTDAINWSFAYAIPNATLYDVIYAEGKLVAVSLGGLIFTSSSTDATTWSDPGVRGQTSYLKSIIFEGSKYVTVGSGGKIYSSSDSLATLTEETSGTNSVLNGVAYDGSEKYLAVGNGGTIVQTADTTPPVTTAIPAGGAYAAAKDVTLSCDDCSAIYYSIDGSAPSNTYTVPITISADTTLKFYAEDIDANVESVKSEAYIINFSRLNNSTLTGTYVYHNKESHLEGIKDLEYVFEGDWTFDGAGNCTISETAYISERDSGTLTYTVDTSGLTPVACTYSVRADGIVSIDGSPAFQLSTDGNIMAGVDSEDEVYAQGWTEVNMSVLVKKGSAMTAADLDGTYVYHNKESHLEETKDFEYVFKGDWTFDGAGNCTISHTNYNSERDSGTLTYTVDISELPPVACTYTVAADGGVTIDGSAAFQLSPNGSVMVGVDSEDEISGSGWTEVNMSVLVKKGFAMTEADLDGTYIYHNKESHLESAKDLEYVFKGDWTFDGAGNCTYSETAYLSERDSVTLTYTVDTSELTPVACTYTVAADGGVTIDGSQAFQLSTDGNIMAGVDSEDEISADGWTEVNMSVLMKQTAAVDLPITGQTTSYATGDDGDILAGTSWPEPRFTDNSDGTVTDNLTGLIFLKNANCLDTVGGVDKSSGTLTWVNGLTWSNNLANGDCALSDGSSAGDWRMPNRRELRSLLDFEQSSSPPLPSGHPYTNVQTAYYWSSTTSASLTSDALAVNMNGGSEALPGKNNVNYVWPVRSGQAGTVSLPKTGQTTCYDEAGTVIACSGTGQDGDKLAGVAWPATRFVDNSDGTITDNLTGLIWLKKAYCAATWRNWATALTDIGSLNSTGTMNSNDCGDTSNGGSHQSDWRLPNLNELDSLANAGQSSNFTWLSGQGFTSVQNPNWTSTTYAPNSSRARQFSFAWSGYSFDYAKSDAWNVWAVRGGSLPPAATIDSLTPASPNEGEAIHFVGSSSAETTSAYEWKVDLLISSTPQGTPQVIGTSNDFYYSSLTAGDYRVYFRVKNANGTWSSEVTQDITISNPAVADLVLQAGSIRLLDTTSGEPVDYVTPGDSVDVEVTVHNPSLYDTVSAKTITVKVFDGDPTGTIINSDIITDVGPGQSEKITVTWTTDAGDSGCLPVSATVDYTDNVGLADADKTVAELTYQNNFIIDTVAMESAASCGGGITVTAETPTETFYAGEKINIQGMAFYPLAGEIGDLPSLGAQVSVDIEDGGSKNTYTKSPDGSYSALVYLPIEAGTYDASITVTDGVKTGTTTLVLNVVTPPDPRPDLYISYLSFSGADVYDYRYSSVNSAVTVKAGVRNKGIAAVTGDYQVSFYNGPVVGGTLIGTASVTADLAADSYLTVSSPVDWTPSATGVYNITAKVDPAGTISEIDELNNERSKNIDIRVPKPDLKSDIGFYGPLYEYGNLRDDGLGVSLSATPVKGDTVTLSAEIYNKGMLALDTESFDVIFYDGDPYDGGQEIGTDSLSNVSIARGAKVVSSVTWDTTDVIADYHTLYVDIDNPDAVDEDFETNNLAYDTFDVYDTTAKLDVVELSTGGNSVVVDRQVYITAYIKNRGATDSSDDTLEFFIGDPDSGGSSLGTASSGILGKGISRMLSQAWTPFAVSQAEKICVKLNGVKSCENIYISDKDADPSVVSLDISLSPSSPCVDHNVLITAKITNEGYDAAENLIVKFYAGTEQVGSGVPIASLAGYGDKTVTATSQFVMKGKVVVKVEINAPAGEDMDPSNSATTQSLSDACGSVLAADAGSAPLQVVSGDAVILDGAGSSGATTYSWTIKTAPPGSSATLDNPDTVAPTLNTDAVGSYTVELGVSDAQSSDYDTVVVYAGFPAPSNISAIDAAIGGAVNLSWTNPTDGNFSHVHIYSSTGLGTLGSLIRDDEMTLSFPDAGLINDTTYYYTVRAVDIFGNESVNTDQSSATPTLPVSSDGLDYAAGDVGAGGDDTLPGVNRVDAGLDSDNLVAGKARLGLYYRFSVVFTDETGENPQKQPKLHIGGRIYNLTCSGGSWAAGKTCSTDLRLPPSSNTAFYFDAIKSGGAAMLRRLPDSGYLTGPTISTPAVAWSMASAPKDIGDTDNLDGIRAFAGTAWRWVSGGLDFEYGTAFWGKWYQVNSASPVKKGEGYLIWNTTGARPDLSVYSDVMEASYEIEIRPGWNLIGNPYNSNVDLSSLIVKRGGGNEQDWFTAAGLGWIDNAIWYLNGSSTYSFDTILAPGMGYWIYVKKDDNTYTIRFTRP